MIRWLQNHVGFVEENGLVHGVQHGEWAWPRLAPGWLLGMGLVFLKFFFIFWKRRQMVRSALGSSSSAKRQGDLGRDVIGLSLAFLGPGGALLSAVVPLERFARAKNLHMRIIELDVNFDRLFLTSPHHMPKFRINSVTMVRLVFKKRHDLLPQKSGFGSCQALALRALIKGVHALEGVFLLNLHGLLKALLKMAE
ncbi:unnamed protein product [Prunus armeniaca]